MLSALIRIVFVNISDIFPSSNAHYELEHWSLKHAEKFGICGGGHAPKEVDECSIIYNTLAEKRGVADPPQCFALVLLRAHCFISP